jgi:hypothetical protein
MPDISYTITGQVSKGALSQSFAASGVTADIATAGVLSVTLNLGTAVTQISTATLGSLGLCFARSLASATTHTVSFGRYAGGKAPAWCSPCTRTEPWHKSQTARPRRPSG